MSTSLTSRPDVVFGGGVLGAKKCPDAEHAKAWADLFRSYGHTKFDSSISYPLENPGESERLLRSSGAASWGVIDTKTGSFGEKPHSRENLLNSIQQSIKHLGFEDGSGQIDVMYLHIPCTDVPFEETVAAMDEARKRGMFKRFGISNYSPEQVEQVCEIAKKNGWTLPTVYQGQYNAIARSGEKTLFPVLRKYGISFYAYT